MLLLDTSGSMDDGFVSGPPTNPRKMDAAKTELEKFVASVGARAPLGLANFPKDGLCGGASILAEPAPGTERSITSAMMPLFPDGNSPIGQAIADVTADPRMHATERPATSYVILVTDANPTCDAAGQTNPAYTTNQIAAAAKANIHTAIVALGDLDPTGVAQKDTDAMAAAGLAPCSGTLCGGHKYYPALSQQDLATALAAIGNQVLGSCTQ
jgi:hypothetical protein